jgi:hypothetical protein
MATVFEFRDEIWEVADDPAKVCASASRRGLPIPALPYDDESPTAAPRRASQCLQRRDLGFALQQQQRCARRKHSRRRHYDQSRKILKPWFRDAFGVGPDARRPRPSPFSTTR